MKRIHVPTIEPYWQWQRHRLGEPLPPAPRGTMRVDVAVVGGGLTGLSTAYHLLRRWPGLRVALLEADVLGAGASGRTTGMLSPGVGQSLPALVRRVGAAVARALYAQTLAAVRAVATLVTDEGIGCDLHLGGQVVFARSPAQQRRLAAYAQLMQALDLGHEVQCLDEAALRARLCVPRFVGTASHVGPAALRFVTAGIVDPLRLLFGLAQRVLARGGHIYEGSRVLHIGGLDRPGPAPGQPLPLQTPAGQVLADHVVLATAGFAPALGLLRGRVLPVQLQALVSEPLSDAARAALGWSDRDGFLDARRVFSYFRLTADQRIVFGGARPRYGWNGGSGSAASLASALSQVAAEAAQLFPPDLGIAIAGGWGGTIGYVLDALPAIGRVPWAPRILHAVGWCGHGVALATASGAWLASMLAGDALPCLPWFRSDVPQVPTELGRYLGFAATTRFLSFGDAWSERHERS